MKVKKSYWSRLLHAKTQSASAFASENSNKSILHHKVPDISGWLGLHHDVELEACASTSLEQFRLTCFCTHKLWDIILMLKRSAVLTLQRRSKQELSRAKCEILLPLTALSFHHPQRLQNVISMAPGAKRRSLCDQNLDRIFCAVAIGCDEPGTQNRSAAVDTTKAMKQNGHGLVSIDSNDRLLPKLETYAFPSGQATLLQCFVLICIAARLLDCDVVQLTMNMSHILIMEAVLPVRWSSRHIHFSVTHGNNHCHRDTKLFFDDSQVASCLQVAKEQSCPIRWLANKATIHRPRCYGFETAIVAAGDFI